MHTYILVDLGRHRWGLARLSVGTEDRYIVIASGSKYELEILLAKLRGK
jgi:hypothetical protein